MAIDGISHLEIWDITMAINVGHPMINLPQVITIFMGGVDRSSPSHGRFMAFMALVFPPEPGFCSGYSSKGNLTAARRMSKRARTAPWSLARSLAELTLQAPLEVVNIGP